MKKIAPLIEWNGEIKTVCQVSKEKGYSQGTIRKWCKEGKLNFLRKGRKIMVAVDEKYTAIRLSENAILQQRIVEIENLIASLRKELKNTPEDVVVLNRLGKMHYELAWLKSTRWKELMEESTYFFEKSLVLEPNNIETLTNLGASLSTRGKHKQALEFLKAAEAAGSTDKNTFFNIGVSMMNIGSERGMARDYFTKACNYTKNPNTIEAYFDPHGH